ncbi:DASH family cryptochrome [Leeia sp. TBRC 13508]|uniref:Cryptochrome DASH n=1 Tax=Leeia speluncae TaxID=2884804 RepID=A0ABS8D905_9NEIS|nr:DASH family cryptochrome [Leeia speluncae]MCB6184702.1 DASH family cryptochrome [Leeia speluncae]
MKTIIYWFRNDLRLSDQLGLLAATAQADFFIPVFVLNTAKESPFPAWHLPSKPRHSRLKEQYLRESLQALDKDLKTLGSKLQILEGPPETTLPKLSLSYQAEIFCEEIVAPEEEYEVARLRQQGCQVTIIWQSSFISPNELPFEVHHLPDVFTQFRQQLEKNAVTPPAPLLRITSIPPLPKNIDSANRLSILDKHLPALSKVEAENFSNSLYLQKGWQAGEHQAQQHLASYFRGSLPSTYKETRNQLAGNTFSTRFSPWLANGNLSARQIVAQLKCYELHTAKNESTYWIWFELLWRDYFRFLHLKYKNNLYKNNGLSSLSNAKTEENNQTEIFLQWINGKTPHPLINAAMNELRLTGWLSNRLRQVVASYWIYELRGDWRLGAAWFEHCLVDFDIYSNQGNWLYIAGLGTDPRGGRRFDIDKQANQYDKDGSYQQWWVNRSHHSVNLTG